MDVNKTAVCYEVIQIGPEVEELDVGDHCLHISTAGDGEGAGLMQPYCIVEERDVVAYWDPEEAE